MTISLHWQYPKTAEYFHDPETFDSARADEWQQQDTTTLLMQDATAALTMLTNTKLPSMIKIDGGYICSKSIYPNIKRDNPNTMTFTNLMKRCLPGQKLYELLQQTPALNTSSNTLTFGE